MDTIYEENDESDGEIPELEEQNDDSDNNNEEMIETINNTVLNFLDRLTERIDSNVVEYPLFSYIKDDEPLTVIYTEENTLIISSIVLLDYYNKYDIYDIVKSNNPIIFTEDIALDISKYMRENIIPEYVEEYIDEVNGISNTPLCSKDLSNLEKSIYDKETDKEEKCQICLEYFKDGHEILKFNSCNHIFCYDCGKTYLEKYNNLCPLCRTEVGDKEKKDTEKIDIGQLVYNFINKYCDRCNQCFFHKEREEIINLFLLNNGTIDLTECVKLIRGF